MILLVVGGRRQQQRRIVEGGAYCTQKMRDFIVWRMELEGGSEDKNEEESTTIPPA